MNQNLDDILQHYASPYYDPDYFQQYYQEHRDEILAKKRKGTKRTDAELEENLRRRATVAATRYGVRKAQKTDTTKLRDEHKANVKVMRDNTKARLQKMTDNLRSYIELLNKNAKHVTEKRRGEMKSSHEKSARKAENANIKAARETTREIESLKKQMKGASPSQKITLQKQVNRLNDKLAREKSKIAITKGTETAVATGIFNRKEAKSKEINAAAKEGARNQSAAEKTKVREATSKAIEEARKSLNDKLKVLRENYKSTLKTEIEKTKATWENSKQQDTPTPTQTDSLAARIKAASEGAKRQSEERRKRNNR